MSRADYLGLTWEIDEFGLDAITPLVEIPGYDGELVINVYVAYDNPGEQCVGVAGSSNTPFTVWACGPDAAFVNHEPNGVAFDTPPTQEELDAHPELNWDSFCTVGLRISDENDAIIVVPGTPGPNTNPWPPSPEQMNAMGWYVPPTIDGVQPPQSIAGPDHRVLVMRLATQGEGLGGQFGVFSCSKCFVPGWFDASPFDCACTADIALPFGTVNLDDLCEVIDGWGDSFGPADLNDDGVVDVEDLIITILHWGPCPDAG